MDALSSKIRKLLRYEEFKAAVRVAVDSQEGKPVTVTVDGHTYVLRRWLG